MAGQPFPRRGVRRHKKVKTFKCPKLRKQISICAMLKAAEGRNVTISRLAMRGAASLGA